MLSIKHIHTMHKVILKYRKGLQKTGYIANTVHKNNTFNREIPLQRSNTGPVAMTIT